MEEVQMTLLFHNNQIVKEVPVFILNVCKSFQKQSNSMRFKTTTSSILKLQLDDRTIYQNFTNNTMEIVFEHYIKVFQGIL